MVLSIPMRSLCSLEGPSAQAAAGQCPGTIALRSEAYPAGQFPSCGLFWLSLTLSFLEPSSFTLHLLKIYPQKFQNSDLSSSALHPPYASLLLRLTCPLLMILFLSPEWSSQQWFSNFSVQAQLESLLQIPATLQPKVIDVLYLGQGQGICTLNQSPRGFYLLLLVSRPYTKK